MHVQETPTFIISVTIDGWHHWRAEQEVSISEKIAYNSMSSAAVVALRYNARAACNNNNKQHEVRLTFFFFCKSFFFQIFFFSNQKSNSSVSVNAFAFAFASILYAHLDAFVRVKE